MTVRQFTRIKQSDHTSFTVADPQRNKSAGVHLRERQNASEHLSTLKLTDTLEALIEQAPTVLRPLSDEGWALKAPDFLKPLASAASALQRQAIARSADLNKRWAGWLASSKATEPATLQELRATVRGAKPAEVMRRIAVNPEVAVSILAQPDGILDASDRDLVAHVERAAVTHNLEKLFASQTERKPSLDDMLAHGPDIAKAKELTQETLRNFEGWRDELDETKAILSQVVHFYSVAAGLQSKESFSMMGLGG